MHSKSSCGIYERCEAGFWSPQVRVVSLKGTVDGELEATSTTLALLLSIRDRFVDFNVTGAVFFRFLAMIWGRLKATVMRGMEETKLIEKSRSRDSSQSSELSCFRVCAARCHVTAFAAKRLLLLDPCSNTGSQNLLIPWTVKCNHSNYPE